MDRRDAYERRVWRLAYLLSGGEADAAANLVRRVVDLQPDLEHLDAARLDRLVVLRAREQRKQGPRRTRRTPVLHAPCSTPAPVLPESARRALDAARSVGTQSAEAWILTRVDGLDLLQVSRAMDCSKTAAERYLAKADEALQVSLGTDLEASIMELRRAADALDPGPILRTYRHSVRKHRRIRLITWILLLAVVGLVGVWLAIKK